VCFRAGDQLSMLLLPTTISKAKKTLTHCREKFISENNTLQKKSIKVTDWEVYSFGVIQPMIWESHYWLFILLNRAIVHPAIDT